MSKEPQAVLATMQEIRKGYFLITPHVMRGPGRVVTTVRWYDAEQNMLREDEHGEGETVPMSAAPDGARYLSAVFTSKGLSDGESHYVDW